MSPSHGVRTARRRPHCAQGDKMVKSADFSIVARAQIYIRILLAVHSPCAPLPHSSWPWRPQHPPSSRTTACPSTSGSAQRREFVRRDLGPTSSSPPLVLRPAAARPRVSHIRPRPLAPFLPRAVRRTRALRRCVRPPARAAPLRRGSPHDPACRHRAAPPHRPCSLARLPLLLLCRRRRRRRTTMMMTTR